MKLQGMVLGLLLAIGYLYAEDVQSHIAKPVLTAELYGSTGNQEAELDVLISKIETIGYSTVAANKNIQVHYYNKYKEKGVEMISFFGMVNKAKLRPLLLKNPDFGAYAPFNFLAYKTLDTENDDVTWYGHLDAEAMLNIIGEKDEALRKDFHAMVDSFDVLVKKTMNPGMSKRLEHTQTLPAISKMKMVKKFETPDDMDEFIEEFIMEHDGLFAKHEFIIAGFIDFKFEYSDMDLDFEKYDAYWVSLLCHFEFSNSIFNRGIPQAGLFAPCSIYFYIPKGSNELHVGYARVDNWINAINIKDQERIDYMRAIDNEVIDIFKELGFVKVEQTLSGSEVVPAVSDSEKEIAILKAKVKQLEAELEKYKKVEPTASKAPVPASITKESNVQKMFTGTKLQTGMPAPKKLSTYYVAQFQDVDTLSEKLEENGFKILAKDIILKGTTVITVTNDELLSTNTFLAALHIMVNESSEVRVQNPSYFGAAFLGEKFKYGQFTGTLKALQSVLGNMYEVEEKYDLSDLPDYNFMFGMPHFDDTITVAEGKEIGSKLKGSLAGKYVSYVLTLPNGTTLVGHKLRSRTYKYLKKIEAEHDALIFPYEVIIQGDKAVMLNPKYYLALSLPLLSMTDFMKIASAPDEIEKDIKRAYQ